MLYHDHSYTTGLIDELETKRVQLEIEVEGNQCARPENRAEFKDAR